MQLDPYIESLGRLWAQATGIWMSGGWCMPAIAAIAMVMFGIGIKVRLQLRRKAFLAVPEATWRRWIEDESARKGPIGDLLDFVTGGSTLEHIGLAFSEVRASEIAPFERNLKVMRICIGAAPLLGLLGTVTGMLATFDALANGSGGEQTMALVSKGISEALITTETGLVVALPGVFFQYQISRRFDRFVVFLAHLETVCTQSLYRRLRRRAVAS